MSRAVVLLGWPGICLGIVWASNRKSKLARRLLKAREVGPGHTAQWLTKALYLSGNCLLLKKLSVPLENGRASGLRSRVQGGGAAGLAWDLSGNRLGIFRELSGPQIENRNWLEDCRRPGRSARPYGAVAHQGIGFVWELSGNCLGIVCS